MTKGENFSSGDGMAHIATHSGKTPLPLRTLSSWDSILAPLSFLNGIRDIALCKFEGIDTERGGFTARPGT